MASAADYARWIDNNPKKKGTPIYEDFVRAYKIKRAEEDALMAQSQGESRAEQVPATEIQRPMSRVDQVPGFYGEQVEPPEPYEEPGFFDKLGGAAETALALGTAATTGFAGALAGGTLGVGRTIENAFRGLPTKGVLEDYATRGMGAFTYFPGSRVGQEYTQAIGQTLGEIFPAFMPVIGPAGTVGRAIRQSRFIPGVAPAQEAIRRVAQAAKPSMPEFIRNRPVKQAKAIMEQVLGNDRAEVLNILQKSPEMSQSGKPGPDIAAMTSGIENPVWQALLRQAQEENPQFLYKLRKANKAQGTNMLAELAGGMTQTGVRNALKVAKDKLNALEGPKREAALDAANLGKQVDELEKRAGRLDAMAAADVQEIRDLIRLGDKAEAYARLDLVKRGLPVGLTKYTYYDELAENAFGKWSNELAKRSVLLGQEARTAQAAADSLRAAGISPLKSDQLIAEVQKINPFLKPEMAGIDVTEKAISKFISNVQRFTDSGGIIDARHLEALRKNSVNETIKDLRSNASVKEQKKLAAGILSELKGPIDNAILRAGGKEWVDYNKSYEKGMMRIAEQKLSGRALKLWKDTPDEFVRLVSGENDKEVEKILGPGRFDVAQEVSERTMQVYRSLADQALALKEADAQASMSQGQQALLKVLKQNTSLVRIPNTLRTWVAALNKTLGAYENIVGDKTIEALGKAARDPRFAQDILKAVSPNDRNRILAMLNDEKLSKRIANRPAGESLGTFLKNMTVAYPLEKMTVAYPALAPEELVIEAPEVEVTP